MITQVDQRLCAEARRYALRFGCEACAAFDPERSSCAYGYPTEQHRAIELENVAEIAFCKAFELA